MAGEGERGEGHRQIVRGREEWRQGWSETGGRRKANMNTQLLYST